MTHFGTRILENTEVAPGWMRLGFAWKNEAGIPRPGQFFTFRATQATDPLLRRPLAFSSFEGHSAGAIYQVRGPATRLLSGLAVGATIDLIAPLGNGFPVRDDAQRILVAGGVGLGPVLFLDSDLRQSSTPETAPLLIVGFRTASAIPSFYLPEGTVVCTDDGSAGFHGTTVDWILSNLSGTRIHLYACGPRPMLASLSKIASRRSWAAHFSVEQWMACGVGACMGCVIRRTDGSYSRACADGPVFEASEIDWEESR